jgi:hypothetical protein
MNDCRPACSMTTLRSTTPMDLGSEPSVVGLDGNQMIESGPDRRSALMDFPMKNCRTAEGKETVGRLLVPKRNEAISLHPSLYASANKYRSRCNRSVTPAAHQTGRRDGSDPFLSRRYGLSDSKRPASPSPGSRSQQVRYCPSWTGRT